MGLHVGVGVAVMVPEGKDKWLPYLSSLTSKSEGVNPRKKRQSSLSIRSNQEQEGSPNWFEMPPGLGPHLTMAKSAETLKTRTLLVES